MPKGRFFWLKYEKDGLTYMKSYVFGASGFIGTHLLKRLVSLHHEVIQVKHGTPYQITDADYIFYLSSYGNHFNQQDKFETIQANIIDLYDLLKHTQHIPYKGFIHFSTSSVNLPVQTLYSDTKAVAEIICKRFYKKYKKPVVSVRPFSIYGPGEADFRFIPTLIKHLKNGQIMPFTDGNHDWTYIDDFIDGVVAVMNNTQSLSGKAIPIGTGKQYSNQIVAGLLQRISGKALSLKDDATIKRPYDTKNWIADTTILKSLGCTPQHTLDEGLKKTYERTY